MATVVIEVVVVPLIILVAPENVCVPVEAVKELPLLVKFALKAYAEAAVSFQTPPESMVTSPLKVFVDVPPIFHVPATVTVPATMIVLLLEVVRAVPLPTEMLPLKDLFAPRAQDFVPEPDITKLL
jgi:hypothetical protein